MAVHVVHCPCQIHTYFVLFAQLQIGEDTPDKRKVWVIARQHPGEPAANFQVHYDATHRSVLHHTALAVWGGRTRSRRSFLAAVSARHEIQSDGAGSGAVCCDLWSYVDVCGVVMRSKGTARAHMPALTDAHTASTRMLHLFPEQFKCNIMHLHTSTRFAVLGLDQFCSKKCACQVASYKFLPRFPPPSANVPPCHPTVTSCTSLLSPHVLPRLCCLYCHHSTASTVIMLLPVLLSWYRTARVLPVQARRWLSTSWKGCWGG